MKQKLVVIDQGVTAKQVAQMSTCCKAGPKPED